MLALTLAVALAAPAVQSAARTDALTRYGVGLFRARAGRPAAALVQFEAAAKADPEAVSPKAALVPVYVDLGRPAAAIRVGRQVVAADPADFATGHTLGQLLYQVKQFPAAVAALKVAAASPRLAAEPGRRVGILADLYQAAVAAPDWPAAEAAARAALPLADADAPIWRERLGRAFENQSKFAAAAAEYRAAAPGADPASRARLARLLSGVLAAEGKDAEALVELERMLAHKPSTTAPYDRLALLLKRLGRTDRIGPTLAALAAENPKNVGIPWVRAEHLGTTDPDAAVKLFGELAAGAEEDAPFDRLVRFYTAANRIPALLDLVDAYALAARHGADDDDPPPAAAPDAAGRAALARFRGLVNAVKAAPGLAPRVAAAYDAKVPRQRDTRQLVTLLADRAGRPDVVEATLREAANAGMGDAVGALLNHLQRRRKWQAILDYCDLYDPNMTGRPRRNGPALVWDIYRANAFYELGRGDEALAAADRAVNVVKEPARVLLRKASLLTGLGRPAEAIAVVEKVLADRPEAAVVQDARLHLAEAHAAAGRQAAADAMFDLALEADPDSVLVLNNYAYNLADQGRRLADAEAMLRYAVELDRDDRVRAGSPDPVHGTYLDSLGWVLFRRGKLAEAKAALEEASRSTDAAGDAVVWDHLGDVYARLGDQAAARTAWTKAVELYADTHQGRKQGRRAEAVRKLGR